MNEQIIADELTVTTTRKYSNRTTKNAAVKAQTNAALPELPQNQNTNTMLVEIITNGTPKLHCPVCNKALATLSGYVAHLKLHEPPGGFCCRYCNARYCTNNELRRHHNENHISLACRLCENITFTNETDYRKHITEVHNGIDRQMYVCDKCGAQYKTYDPYQRHVSTNCGNIKPHKCDKCDMCFVTKYNLKQHMESHTGELKFCCSYCGKNFLQKGRLVEHERSHTGEKPYKCDVCGKCFAHRESIVTHSSIHTGIRLVECKCCLSRFSCYSNLLKHRRTRPDSCGLPEFDPPKNRTRTHRSRIPPTINPTSEIKVVNLNKVLKAEEKIKNEKRKRRTKPTDDDTPTKSTTDTNANATATATIITTVNKANKNDINIQRVRKKHSMNDDVDVSMLIDDNSMKNQRIDDVVDADADVDVDYDDNDTTSDYKVDFEEYIENYSDVDDKCVVRNMATPPTQNEFDEQQNENKNVDEEAEYHDVQVNNFVNAEINIKVEEDIKLFECIINNDDDNSFDNLPEQIEIFNVDTDCAVSNLLTNSNEKDVLEETEIEIVVQNENNATDAMEIKAEEQDIFQPQLTLKHQVNTPMNRKTKKSRNGKITEIANENEKSNKNPIATTIAMRKNKKLPIMRVKTEGDKVTTKNSPNILTELESSNENKCIENKDTTKRTKRSSRISQQELRARLSLLRKTDKTFSCPYCIKIYHMRRPFEKHLQNDHHLPENEILQMVDTEDLKDIEKEIFKCKICKKIYLVEKRLLAHEKLHGSDGKLIHKCPCYCSIYFGTKEEAKMHAQKEHRDLIYCKICKKFMNGHDSLKTHMKNHHHNQQQQQQSAIEDNDEKNGENFVKKIYTPRTMQRNLVCEKCGKKFAGRTSLTDHVRSDCGRVPLYACKICGKHLTTAGILKTHMLLHKDDTPFQCDQCGKTFKVKAQYKTHIKIRHTNNKPFKCHLCPKEYPYRESLLTHMTVHTGIKRFLCVGCCKRFTCISNLQAHRRVNADSCGLLPLNAKATQYMGVQKGNLLIGAKPEAGVDYKETNTLIAKEVIEVDLPQEFLSCEEPQEFLSCEEPVPILLDKSLLITSKADGL